MNTEEIKDRGQDWLLEAETYVRENPLPALLGALAIGFTIGLLTRTVERERPPEPLHDAVAELAALLKPLSKKTKKAYAESSDAVREAVAQAVEKAKDFEVDQYTDPLAKWWKRLWA